MNLQQLLSPSHILLRQDVTSKKRLFEEVGFLFERTSNLNRTVVTESLFARERLGSTGLGSGVAIPHGRIKGLKEPKLAIIQLISPIGFDAVDSAPVELIFALLVPENATQKHLDLLAQIAEVLGDESKRAILKTAATSEAVMAAIL